MTEPDSIAWARAEAQRLRTHLGSMESKGQVGPGVEFLRTQAGPRSHFYVQAADMAKTHAPKGAIRGVADLLDGWANFVEAGYSAVPLEVRIRNEAATDLMEQVQALLDDRRVHSAAPVMLAGAALEEFLRSLLVGCPIPAKGKAGINSYVTALREADILSAQDVKDVTAWAGLRNHAAHGEFDQIDLQRARLMVDGINLFMRQRAVA